MKKSTAKHIVVVTHHLPTLAVVAPQHKGSVLNGAFATELGDYIAGSCIDVWIYGDLHTNIDITIGNTRIVCNQLGYAYYNEHLTNGSESNKYLHYGFLAILPQIRCKYTKIFGFAKSFLQNSAIISQESPFIVSCHMGSSSVYNSTSGSQRCRAISTCPLGLKVTPSSSSKVR